MGELLNGFRLTDPETRHQTPGVEWLIRNENGMAGAAVPPSTLDPPMHDFLRMLVAPSLGVWGGALAVKHNPDRAESVLRFTRHHTLLKMGAVAAGRVVDAGDFDVDYPARAREDAVRASGLLQRGFIGWPWGEEAWLVLIRFTGSKPGMLLPQRWALMVDPLQAAVHALLPMSGGGLGLVAGGPIGGTPWVGDADMVQDATTIALSIVAMLNTRGIAIETLPPKPSGRRARPGLVRLPTRWWALAKSASGPRAAGDGHHASPVAHLRRGHLRQLPDGRATWVRDHLVGARSEGELAFVERHRAGLRLPAEPSSKRREN